MNLKNQLSPKGTVFSEKAERIGKNIVYSFATLFIFLLVLCREISWKLRKVYILDIH